MTVELPADAAYSRTEKTRVLELIEELLTNGKDQLVREAIAGEISHNTLTNWLRDKGRADKAYKSDALLRIKTKLPSLADLKKYEAFSFALEELGLDRRSQIDLRAYHGIYDVQHRLKADDGLVVLRRSRLYLLGLAKGAMFSGHVRAVAEPAHDILKGLAVYEDFNGENVSASKIVLVNHTRRVTQVEQAAIEEYLGPQSTWISAA